MKLPSIHTLLNPAPPSPPTYDVNDNSYSQKQQALPAPPSVQVLPASPGPLSVDTMALSPMLSPALSSNRSPSVSSVGSISPMTMNMSDFPPIHGDDPPPRRRPVQSTPLLQPRTPANYLHQHKRSFSQGDKPLYADSHSDQGICAIGPTTLPTPPTSFSSPSPPPSIVISPSASSSASENKHNNKATTITNKNLLQPTTSNKKSRQSTATKGVKELGPAPPPCTEILISPTGQPILKRRRGRPPTRSPGYEEGGWTFLSPTVWDVASPSSSSPSSSLSPEQQQQYDRRGTAAEDEGMMNDAMTAFTSADMDTVLPMPKKKRGRKPKTHIEG
ncbi:hypothetical protein BCR42DRAFT_403028, partial [Absidia repens]